MIATDADRLIHLAKFYLAVHLIPYMDDCTAYVLGCQWKRPAPDRPPTFAQFVRRQAPELRLRSQANKGDFTAWARIAMNVATGTPREAKGVLLPSDDKKHLSPDGCSAGLRIQIAFDDGCEWPTEYIIDEDGTRVGLLYEYPEFVGDDAYDHKQWANPCNWRPGPLADILINNPPKRHAHRRGSHHDTGD